MSSEAEIRYSIVVPFFNEQENIPPLYMKLTEVMDSIGEPYELVFVDDGSRDNSFRVLSEIYEHDRRVNLIRLQAKFLQQTDPRSRQRFDFARNARSSSRWTATCSMIRKRFPDSWKKSKRDMTW